jgi:general secretion pathway protein C
MKTMFLISVACAALMAAATTTHSLTGGGPGTDNLPGIPSSSNDADGAAGETADFRLLGIAFSKSLGQALAVIEIGPDRRQQFIHEGDSIGEVTVQKIQSDQVVFETAQGERIARLNRIYLDSNKAGGTLLSEQSKMKSLPTVLKRSQTVEVDRKELSISLADIDKAIRDVKISAVRVYGRPVGVRIPPVEPGSVFDKIGLKNGDVIKAVNGETIRKPEEAIAFLERIREGGELDIDIKGSRRSRILQLIVK